MFIVGAFLQAGIVLQSFRGNKLLHSEVLDHIGVTIFITLDLTLKRQHVQPDRVSIRFGIKVTRATQCQSGYLRHRLRMLEKTRQLRQRCRKEYAKPQRETSETTPRVSRTGGEDRRPQISRSPTPQKRKEVIEKDSMR
jgi:hypothetical protein